MKSLFRFLRHYLPECILGPLFKLLEASLDLAVPLIVAAIIDNGISAGADGTPYIVKMCLLLILLGIVGLALAITAQYFAAKAATGAAADMRSALFRHVSYFSRSDADTLGVSTLITRLTGDTEQVQTGVNLSLRLLLRSPFVVFGAMITAFFVDAKTAVVFAIIIPLLSVAVFTVMLVGIPMFTKVRGKLDGLLGLTREGLSGARVVRAFRKEADEEAEFSTQNSALTKIQKLSGAVSAALNPLTYVIINLGIILLFRFGAVRVKGGDISQGELVAMYNYMTQISVELIKLASLIITITKSISSAKRISAIFDVKSGLEVLPSQPDGADAVSPSGKTNVGIDDLSSVEFRRVSLKYRSSSEKSLEDISFSVKRGERVGIIGSTGSGKTSLVNLIPRFYDASEGEVLVDGVNVNAYDPQVLRRKIGVVPQRATLFSGSIRDNVAWGNTGADDGEIYAALEAAQAKDVVDGKGGLDFVIEQGGANLSGGQRQRLTIARALVRRPEILILDDSASALDYATDAALRKAIFELPERPTVFIVSQRAASVMKADIIIVLEDGKIEALGTHEELLRDSEVYREIYTSQYTEEAAK